jgi:SOS-response transcriptional repressor LexA
MMVAFGSDMRMAHSFTTVRDAQQALREPQSAVDHSGMSVGPTIRALRKSRGMTILELANSVGSDVGNVSRLERGRQGYTQDTLERISTALGVKISDLFGDQSDGDTFRPTAALGRIPVVSWVQAGAMQEIEKVAHRYEAEEFADLHHVRATARMFALRVEGDSMQAPPGQSPSFPAGTLIVVDPDRAAKPGDYVIAKDVRTQSATFKRLVVDAGTWFLMPLNSSFQAIEIDDPAQRVIGVAVEWQVSGRL